MSDHELSDAIWDYLNVCTQKLGHRRTAERFGDSREGLWRFLDCDQDGDRLPHAVLGSVGDRVEALISATDLLVAGSASRHRLQSPNTPGADFHEAPLGLCEAPLAS